MFELSHVVTIKVRSCHTTPGSTYSIGAVIGDIRSQQPVSGCELTATHSVKNIVFEFLY